jgi:heme/copper-type cytochrome/quinol oxidase subunit 2
VTEIGKIVIGIGILLVVVGVVFWLLGRANIPVGSLPGDIVVRRKNFVFYFPLITSIILSIVLTLVLYLVARLRH